jgi:uncharacterized protein
MAKIQGLYYTLPIISGLLGLLTFASPSLAETKQLLRTLTVTGKGVESIATTVTKVELGVEIQGKTANMVQQEAAKRSDAVVKLLRSRNVQKLETTGIRLNPIYNYQNNQQKITGYSATNSVSFRIATDQAGNIMDEAVNVGATKIDSVSFIASDAAISSAQQKALQLATLNAKKQADAVLSALNLSPKEVVNIQINSANPPTPIYADAMVAKSAIANTPVVGGDQQVEAAVTLQISY